MRAHAFDHRRSAVRIRPTLDVNQSGDVHDGLGELVGPRRLVFIDETWVKTNMAPIRGWGPRGARFGHLVTGKQPSARFGACIQARPEGFGRSR
jgi:hypothetical protein